MADERFDVALDVGTVNFKGGRFLRALLARYYDMRRFHKVLIAKLRNGNIAFTVRLVAVTFLLRVYSVSQ